MVSPADRSRRAALMALAALPLSNREVVSVVGSGARLQGSRTLVAYFSRSGNTRVIAGLIHRSLAADLFEIQPARPYPEDYLATVDQAQQERDSGYQPPLAATISDVARYDTVFLGFPVWGETVPPVIRTFLVTNDLSGKNLIPFTTHGGYGLGNSRSVIACHAPKARLRQGFLMEADQERRTMNRVAGWLDEIKTKG
ncbi:flavodoxin [Caballeronia calidae]|uniref:Flavodoxin n=1 Tax=Caballeronia calidae TaxID=1777139 RepID=A0A158A7M8_9BURK|nr:flavodoxin [Caballeronia calidae]SAK53844.1 flavodoxin [Caballeronia calidae]